jgi:hypothetical protein
MQISNDDLSNKEENKNEKKINVNLQNRKYNLNKLKNVYQEQINQMIIKIDQLKNTKEENEINLDNNINIVNLKKEIENIQKQNDELNKKTSEIEKENEQLELFFKNYFEKNNKSIKD